MTRASARFIFIDGEHNDTVATLKYKENGLVIIYGIEWYGYVTDHSVESFDFADYPELKAVYNGRCFDINEVNNLLDHNGTVVPYGGLVQ